MANGRRESSRSSAFWWSYGLRAIGSQGAEHGLLAAALPNANVGRTKGMLWHERCLPDRSWLMRSWIACKAPDPVALRSSSFPSNSSPARRLSFHQLLALACCYGIDTVHVSPPPFLYSDKHCLARVLTPLGAWL